MENEGTDKQDNFIRIQTVPEKFTTGNYKSKLPSMGTISMLYGPEN